MIDKALITSIGIASVERREAQFWYMEDDNPELYRNGTMGGYTLEELEQIAHVRDVLTTLKDVETPINLTIPWGRYALGVFTIRSRHAR